MNTTYFFLALLSLLLSINLFFSIKRPGPLAVLSFLFGWLVGELTFYVMALQMLGTLIFVACGAVSGLAGALGLLFSLLAWGGMLYHFLDALQTGERAEQALQQAEGVRYQNKIDADLLAQIPTTLDPMRLIKPFALHLPQVKRNKDIVIATTDGVEIKIDVYHKFNKPEQAPVLYHIHGGGWTQNLGDKSQQAIPLMNQLAAMGWVCVSIDYRLSPKATWPAHIIDCKRGMAWIRANIADYGGNPDFVIATGGSAGGQLSSLLALTPGDPEFQPGFEDVDTSVNACVPFYGVYDFTNANKLHHNDGLVKYASEKVFKKSLQHHLDEFQQASPLHRIHKAAPPFFVIHGAADSLAAEPEAAKFVEQLRATSKKSVAYHVLPYAQHGFDIFRSPHSEYTLHAVMRYVNYIYSLYLNPPKKRATKTKAAG